MSNYQGYGDSRHTRNISEGTQSRTWLNFTRMRGGLAMMRMKTGHTITDEYVAELETSPSSYGHFDDEIGL